MASSFQSRLGTTPGEGVKAPCVVATTTNITLSGEQTISSTDVVAGDRVLVRAQTSSAENGIYICAASTWSRATDWDSDSDVANGVLVLETANGRAYRSSYTGTFVLGTTAVSFIEGGFDNASGITYTPAGAGAVDTDVQSKLREVVSVKDFGVVGTGDETSKIQAALNTGRSVIFPDGDYTISDALSIPSSNTSIILHSGVSITQTTADKQIFTASSLDSVWIIANGATLTGEGSWSASWTGNSGHDDRVIAFTLCTNSGIVKPYVKNGANAGIYLNACTGVLIDSPIIEGTHTNGVALNTNDNFQNGIFIKHDPTNGACKNITVKTPEISGTAQGILIEGYSGFVQSDDMNITIECPNIHDIPGQHGIYCQTGKINIVSPIIDNCALDGVKIQDNITFAPYSINISNLNITDCGSAGVELQTTTTGGSVSNVKISGTIKDCQRGLSINADVASSTIKDVDADLQIYNSTQYAVLIQSDASAVMENFDIKIDSDTAGFHGVYVTSSPMTNLNLYPRIRKSGGSVANTYDGVYIENCSDAEIWNPDITDADGNQRYGLFVVAGSVGVHGRAVIKNGTTYSARANVELSHWPSNVDLGGSTSTLLLNRQYFATSKEYVYGTAQSTSTSNVVIWEKDLADESAYMITATVVAKLSDSSDRESWTRSCLAYRDAGGNATIDTQADIENLGTSGAVLAFDVTGTRVRLVGNSGAAVTYDWESRVHYTKVS